MSEQKLIEDTTEFVEEITEQVEDKELFGVITNAQKIYTYTKENNHFDLVVCFKLPTLKQKDIAEMLYTKRYNQLLKDEDVLTVQQLLNIAENRGLWTDKDRERLSGLNELILAKKEQVAEEKNKKKKEKFEEELLNLRDEKYRLALRVGGLTANGLENLAEKERTVYMLTHCAFVVDENGNETPLYKDKQEIEQEQDYVKFERLLLDGKTFWSGEGLGDFFLFED